MPTGSKSKPDYQGLHAPGFADVVFQVCPKVNDLFHLFDVA